MYLDSCSGNSKIFPEAGGANDQTNYFWMIVRTMEQGLNDYEDRLCQRQKIE